jgi:hypothetical protein
MYPAVRRGLVAALFFVLTLCGSPLDRAFAQPAAMPNRSLDFMTRLGSSEAWQQLCIRPGSHHLSNSEVVKFVLDSAQGRVYFLQSERWPLHHSFARRFLSTLENPVPDLMVFLKPYTLLPPETPVWSRGESLAEGARVDPS